LRLLRIFGSLVDGSKTLRVRQYVSAREIALPVVAAFLKRFFSIFRISEGIYRIA
jgi:hypothetical protein